MDWHHYTSVAAAAGIVGAWRTWKTRRNSLPDDERALIFWNDERYERLQRGITISLWSLAAVLAVAVALAFGLMYYTSEGPFS